MARRYPLHVIGAITWTTLILGLYYWVHKPVTPALVRALGGAFLDVAVATVFVAVAGGLGHRLLRRVDLSNWSELERIAAAGLIGLSGLSLLILIIGVVMLNALSIAVLLIVVAVLIWHDLASWMGSVIRWVRSGLPRDRWSRFLALAALTLLLMALSLSVLPPTKFDVLTYHLAGPRQYVEHGRFYAAPHNHFLGFPQLVENLYSAQLALTGRLAGGGPIHWGIGVLALLAVGGYAGRRSGVVAGWSAVAILLTSASVWMEMTFSYVDLMPLGLAVTGMAVFESWKNTRQNSPNALDSSRDWRLGLSYLILLGSIAGFGMGTKYTVLWMGAAFGLLIVLTAWRSGGWRVMIVCGTVYGATAAAVAGPWLIRNVIWYHNPVYPFVFDVGEMDAIRQDWYNQPESGVIYGSNAWQVPLMPVTATFLGIESGAGYGADIGPLFLVLMPLGLLVLRQFTRPERATATRLLIFAGVLMVIWMIAAGFGSYINQQTRLMLYMFGPLAVAAGMILETLRRLPKKPIDISFIMRAMVALTLVFTIISGVQTFADHGVGIYFSGEDGYKTDYLLDQLGWHYETMRQINALPEGVTVRFLWEPRYLYCDNERIHCYTDSLMDAWYYARRTLNDPGVIAERWRAEGTDYLLVYEFGREYEEEHAQMYDESDWDAWEVFVNAALVEVWRNGNTKDDVQYILYRWRSS